MTKRHLITSALPYANGPIHFGHIAGVYLPADIYTRHRKMQGEKCLHISGSDEHGVAIMQNAQKEKIPYKEYVDGWHKNHSELFKKYGIHFDFFGQTSSEYHKEETLKWFEALHDKKFIEKQADEQLQCQDCSNFLPDRFVEGTCYECGYVEARGDECPKCGTWIDAIKLISPICKFCDSKNIEIKTVDQWYLMLSKYHKEFRQWFETKKDWRKTVFSFVDSLSKEKMVDRAITRDLDWGIDVPLEEAKGKKLYVWFDAPIGYVSNTKKYLEESGSGEDYMSDWWQSEDTELTHFIGKDNVIFHSIIFPAMSMASGRAKPVDELPANQYVNLEGKQFSKSKGWYVDADEAIEQFGSTALRYYLTTLVPETADSSFTWEGFENKINGELANNIGNFINRSLKFYKKNWGDGIEASYFSSFFESNYFSALMDKVEEYRTQMNKVQVKKGLETVMQMGQLANTFFSDHEPWATMKTDEDLTKKTIAHSAIYALVLGTFMGPFLPELAQGITTHFEISNDQINEIYKNTKTALPQYFTQTIVMQKKPKGLVPKIDSEVIEKLKEELSQKA